MIIGGHEFDVNNRTYIMGILNVTQDSFSDGGKFNDIDRALFQTEKMVKEGAHIIDVGGESTRPGYIPVSAEQEIDRVIPVISKIKSEFNIPISIDTQKAIVAKAGVEAKVDIINDIWGLKGDPDMASVIANSGVHCVLMHNRKEMNYVNYLDDVYTDLSQTLEIANRAGIDENRIILDPGVGFAKNTEQNLEIMAHVDKLRLLGCPVLLAASRKSVIGNTLGLPVDDRVEGTLALTALAVQKKCAFVRVHDVKENKRVIDMLEAVYNYG
ncbi:MAG: dihydropteroate synthase [Lachnospiraceae bacterium]|nr:dihydropteroate synthase [Lachnospiraceae bacterium]